jgi:beta-glucanase (GH16 family)
LKNLSLIIFLIFSSTSLLFAQTWNLIWSDEFNGSSLDATKWVHDIGTGSQYGLYGWGNSELQYYQPQNTVVNNGTAKIIAQEETNGIIDSWNNTYYYSSSKITTKGLYDFKYGKIQARIKTIDGQGFWPAFWMLPTGGSWPCDGEIDIMEQWGSSGPTNITTGAAHVGLCPYSQGSYAYNSFSHPINSGSYADNFHIYEIRWDVGYIAWYIDNIQVYYLTPSMFPPQYTWPFDNNDWYLMLNLAITSSGPNSNTVFPSQIEIDYVRVYENIYTTNFNVTFQLDMNNVTNSFTTPEVNGTFNNWCGNCWAMSDLDGDNIWNFTISIAPGTYQYKFAVDNWAIQENLVNAGNCVVSAWGYTNRVLDITSDTILNLVCWESCSGCPILGCTNPLATNYNALATVDDGSCTLPTSCTGTAPITGVYVDGIIDTRATFNWDNMNTAVCDVDQLLFRYREVGTSAWLSKTLGQPLGTTNTYATSKTVLGLLPATTYEYQCKIWYAGVSAPVNFPANPSGTFTTLGVCPNVTNLTVTTPTTTKATFTWDASNGAYAFVRLKARVEINNSSWFNIGGTGVNYPAVTKDKNGLLPGQTYRGQGRTFCDPNGGAYFSPAWTPLVTWTQPTSIRLEGGESIANLEVYPNPSRNVFNISFTSETVQNLKLRVLNVVAEEIILEDLQQFVGEYTKSINLKDNAKGIYFLEIETDEGIINKKLILQ